MLELSKHSLFAIWVITEQFWFSREMANSKTQWDTQNLSIVEVISDNFSLTRFALVQPVRFRKRSA